MSRSLRLSCAVAATILCMGRANADWSVASSIDPLTGQAIATAASSYDDGGFIRSAVVRCTGTRLEVLVGFQEFLDTDLVPVRYRIDTQPLESQKWNPSADGTAVFASEQADIARAMLTGHQLIVEATDFRGVAHRATFELAGAQDSIKSVLEKCQISAVGIDQKVSGLRHEIALDLERWGPRNITVDKKILAALGYYSGGTDPVIEPAFALAAQSAYDDYVAACRAGRVLGTTCDSVRETAVPVMPSLGEVLFDLAPPEFRREAGGLYINQ